MAVQSSSGGGSSFPDNRKSSTPTGTWAHVSSEKSLGRRQGGTESSGGGLPRSVFRRRFCPGLVVDLLTWSPHRSVVLALPFPHNGPQKRGDRANVTQNGSGRAGIPAQAVWLLHTGPGFCLWLVRAAHSLLRLLSAVETLKVGALWAASVPSLLPPAALGLLHSFAKAATSRLPGILQLFLPD